MTKTPIDPQELRRRMYRKAKSDRKHRFWGIFIHITKREVLEKAYLQAKKNGGAPGVDGQTFEDIESSGREAFLSRLREELTKGTYKPRPNRPVETLKGDGKKRKLQIPCIRDRVVQGALKWVIEPIFEADFCPNSHGFRPGRSPHRALAEVRRSLYRRMSTVIDVDLSRYFDTIRHGILLQKIARRVEDPDVLHLVKQIIKAGGKIGVPQGGPFSPLAANIYLNEVDWYFDAIRQRTTEGEYEQVNYHRFADDIVITVSGHYTKVRWAPRALLRLREQIEPLGLVLNTEKTKVVDTLSGEAFGFMGFDIRRVLNRERSRYFFLLTPRKKARLAIKTKIREIISAGGVTPVKELVNQINAALVGWVAYFRVGNSSDAFNEVRDYLEMKLRILLTRRKKKRGVGWRRWSSEHLYKVLGLYRDWKIQYLKNPEAYT
jgi:group II intron reverse transcriptase/maturase